VLKEKLNIADINDVDIIEPISIKFEDLFHVVKILGIGAFGVVLEVINYET
jgi:hypothetical protein